MHLTTFILRDTSRPISKSREHRGCGITRVGPDVTLSERAGRSKVRNVKTCGLRHVCANCAEHGLAERAVQVMTDVDVWLASGRSVISVTLTLPHTGRDRLAKLCRWLEAGIEATVRKGRPANRIKSTYKVVAVDRTTETDWSDDDGWHPHAHLLLYIDGCISDEHLQALRDDLRAVYLTALRNAGALASRLSAWAAEKTAVDVRRVTSARSTATYLTKSPVEQGRATGQFAVLATLNEHRRGCSDGRDCGTCRCLVAVWKEYVDQSRNRPRFTAPKNFDRLLRERGLVRPQAQREIAQERAICVVAGEAWDLAARYEATDALRAASLDEGLQGVRRVVAHLLAADGASDVKAAVRATLLVRPPAPPRRRANRNGQRLAASLRTAWRRTV